MRTKASKWIRVRLSKRVVCATCVMCLSTSEKSNTACVRVLFCGSPLLLHSVDGNTSPFLFAFSFSSLNQPSFSLSLSLSLSLSESFFLFFSLCLAPALPITSNSKKKKNHRQSDTPNVPANGASAASVMACGRRVRWGRLRGLGSKKNLHRLLLYADLSATLVTYRSRKERVRLRVLASNGELIPSEDGMQKQDEEGRLEFTV
jgi:hypothetical protein